MECVHITFLKYCQSTPEKNTKLLARCLRSPESGDRRVCRTERVWSPWGRCWLWVVWDVRSLKNTCCHLVDWNRLPCSYLRPGIQVQLLSYSGLIFLCVALSFSLKIKKWTSQAEHMWGIGTLHWTHPGLFSSPHTGTFATFLRK